MGRSAKSVSKSLSSITKQFISRIEQLGRDRAALSFTPLVVLMTGRAALDAKITKQLKDLRQRQAAYHASLQRIADAQRAVAKHKLLGDSDPSREAILFADYQEALNQLLETGTHVKPACENPRS